MTRPHYERLSALDAAMLFMETGRTHMHIGEVGILDAGPLTTSGGLDVERIRAHVAGSLDKMPRYRQRLAFIPVEQHPVWVDDDHFNLNYHVRYTSLPSPGTARQLKRVVGRIMSQQLDLSKPLWEIWMIEGLEGGRVALMSKVHHCMVDGISAVNALLALFSADPDVPTHRPSPWRPRPVPSAIDLAREELQRRAGAPLALARSVATALADPGPAIQAIRDALEGAVEAVAEKSRPASTTPLNVDEIGPHRRVDWIRLDLDEVKAVKNRLGGKVNDVILAIVAGAIRRYMEAHRTPVRGLDFRVVVPINRRPLSAVGELGNRVVPMLARLPLDVHDPRERLRVVAERTQAVKASKQVYAIELFEEVSNWADAALIAQFVRRVTRWWAGNLIVTNVPGFSFPLYFLGARLLEGYPLVPMMANQALNVAVLSYAGGLYWGFNADWDAITDLHDLVQCFTAEFADLKKVAGPVTPARSHRARKGAVGAKVSDASEPSDASSEPPAHAHVPRTTSRPQRPRNSTRST